MSVITTLCMLPLLYTISLWSVSGVKNYYYYYWLNDRRTVPQLATISFYYATLRRRGEAGTDVNADCHALGRPGAIPNPESESKDESESESGFDSGFGIMCSGIGFGVGIV